MKRIWTKLALGCAIALVVGGLIAAANSYVTVTADSATVVCLGADFLVIPDDPFSDSAIRVSVSANQGWILTSPSPLSIVPGQADYWSVEGDEDNPEDRASGNIYVAKVDLSKTRIELLRRESEEVPFTVTPSFAKEYISFEIKKFNDEQVTQSPVSLRRGLRALATPSNSGTGETSAVLDVEGEKILFRNEIPENRRNCGSDCEKWLFCAQDGERIVLFDKKKKISCFSGYAVNEIAASFEEITSLSTIARDGISAWVDGQMPMIEIPIERQMLKSQTAKAFSDTFCPYIERVESKTKELFFPAIATKIANNNNLVDESFDISFASAMTGNFSGGSVTFSASPNPVNVSLYNWMSKIASDGSVNLDDFRFESLSASLEISANGHTATGNFSVGLTLRTTFSKEFFDSVLDNIGSVPFLFQMNIGVSF